MTVAKVHIPGRSVSIQEEAKRLARCFNCEFACKDGNCSKFNKRITTVEDDECLRK